MTVALVIGGAECVWKDLVSARALFQPDVTVAINHIGVIIARELDHWVSYHADQLTAWIQDRRKNRLPDAVHLWTGPLRPGNINPNIMVTKNTGGSSGYLATMVGLRSADLVVLCGVPLDPTMPHWHKKQRGKPWKEAAAYHDHWRAAVPTFASRVRSVSGWTAELLGTPNREWLAGGMGRVEGQ